ncbi:hypothetical protein B0H34DRAFT_725369 [Crassisporium funariophilum]|nr:hypothetical protein B0H34DRAFT_725369 [Crassisporium funariophilum]
MPTPKVKGSKIMAQQPILEDAQPGVRKWQEPHDLMTPTPTPNLSANPNLTPVPMPSAEIPLKRRMF